MDARGPVLALFSCLGDRDFRGARALFADDATWHLTGSHDLAGDLDPDAYLALLERFFAGHPAYALTAFDLQETGEDVVVVTIETEGGPAPGRASGLMVYRVQDGLVVEGWAIPTFAGGRYPF